MNWYITINKVWDRMGEEPEIEAFLCISKLSTDEQEQLPRAGEGYWLVTGEDFRKHILKEEE